MMKQEEKVLLKSILENICISPSQREIYDRMNRKKEGYTKQGEVMAVSILKIHGSILDVYWGVLISGIYVGILSLSFLHHKRFILIKDRFYYRSFKQKLEGSIEEIEGCGHWNKGRGNRDHVHKGTICGSPNGKNKGKENNGLA